MRVRSAVLLGLGTLLFGCAEQPTGFATGYNSYEGPEYATPVYPGYGYAPGYLGPSYYGSDVIIGGGGYWAAGEDRDRYWYHRHHGRDRNGVWQGNELRQQNEAEARAQAWQQLQQQQQQRTAAQAAQAQAVQQINQQRAQALAAQNQAIWQQRVAQAQAVQQINQQRAQALAAQQQAIAAARARGLAQ